ncbi:MAG: hypothetical protein K940chlam9_00764 [Chlamydiae bacterium]|nr:hypothetical protein [Chlamydiota bacterium]
MFLEVIQEEEDMCLRSDSVGRAIETDGRRWKTSEEAKWKTRYSISVAIGAILLVGSIFALLAANQIFPHGANVFGLHP